MKSEQDRRQPNVIVVFADQMRGMDMGCAGNIEVSTPNMDRLASQGARFSKAYANTPVCGPSRATLLTGRYPFRHGVPVNDFPLPQQMPTIGQAFKEAGYHTGYIGKWHLDGLPRNKWTPPGPRRFGFDFWAAYNCSHQYFRPGKYYMDSPEPVEIDGYEPAVQTDTTLQFLEEHQQEPFCLFVSWGPPHDPYDQVPEAYLQQYEPERLSLRPNVRSVTEQDNPLVRQMQPRLTLARYYAAITALDEQLGRIMNKLEELQLEEDTIIVFTSDHGDMLWSQGMMKKQLPWEEAVSVPLLVRWPGRIPAGHVSEELIGLVDLAPTLLALAGAEGLTGTEGSDCSRLLLDPEADGAESVFLCDPSAAGEARAQGVPEWRAVRTKRFTYAAKHDGTPWLLYDNDADPYQLHNVVDSPAYESERAELAGRLRNWMVRAGDPGLPCKPLMVRLGLTQQWNAAELSRFGGQQPDLIEESSHSGPEKNA